MEARQEEEQEEAQALHPAGVASAVRIAAPQTRLSGAVTIKETTSATLAVRGLIYRLPLLAPLLAIISFGMLFSFFSFRGI